MAPRWHLGEVVNLSINRLPAAPCWMKKHRKAGARHAPLHVLV